MKAVAAPQEDLQVLGQILQQHLRAEIPEGGCLQVRCASQNGILWVLIQHPDGVSVDAQSVFSVLQQELRSQKSQQVKQPVQLFLRVVNQKRPYAKHNFVLQPPPTIVEQQPPFREFENTQHSGNQGSSQTHQMRMETPADLSSPNPSNSYSPSAQDNKAEEISSYPPGDDSPRRWHLVEEFSPETREAPSLQNPSSLWEEPAAPAVPNHNGTHPDPSVLWSDEYISDITQTVAGQENGSPTDTEPPITDKSNENLIPEDPSVLWGDKAAEPTDTIPRGFVPKENEVSEDPSILWDEVPPAESRDSTATEADPPGSLVKVKPKPNLKPFLVGGAVLGIAAFAGGAYIASQPCAVGACQPLQNAVSVQTLSSQRLRNARGEQQLVAVQQQLKQAEAGLKPIPSWSSSYQQAQQMGQTLSAESDKINQVVTALQTATQAQKMQFPPNTFQELQSTQNLWRKAITPLEAINSSSNLYNLAQANLPGYRANLRNVNQQLQAEQRIANRINQAKAVAQAATTRQAAAKSLGEWQKVQATWQVAVNTLASIPQNNFAFPEAQRLLETYRSKLKEVRDRTTQEQIAAKAFNRAVNSANLAKRYEQQNQWSAAVTNWNRAVEAARQVPSDSIYSTQAQPLVNSYAQGLQKAEANLKVAQIYQTARNDLNKTCGGAIRICNFSVNGGKITIRLTSQYEQAVQRSMMNPASQPVASNANHTQILLQALEVISQNANLPMTVYSSQNQQIYPLTHRQLQQAMTTWYR
jgi:tetratricopeptide (TPR) repeat protein